MQQGELDDIRPGVVVINIGTNTSAIKATAPRTAAAKLLLLGIHPSREAALVEKAAATNRLPRDSPPTKASVFWI